MSALPTSVDVVVLGGGLAGCAATLSAAEAGRKVLLLEKQSDTGGSTVLSAGLSAFAGTEEQARQDIDDSVDLLRRDLLETGLHLNDPKLIGLYCREQLGVYRWLKGHGVRYGTVHAASGQSVPRSHPTDTRLLLDTLLAKATGLGATVVTGAHAQRLVADADQVTGVEVTFERERHRISSNAVIIATGGFSQNQGLLARFAPQMRLALRGGGAGSQGEGLLMAWKLGAGFVDTPHIKGTYGIHPEPVPGESGTGILAVYKGAVAVNRDGHRFVDESLPYKVIGDASLAQPGGVTYQVFDAKVMAAGDDEVPIYDFVKRERDGALVKANTISGLAELLELPAGALERTVSAYNEAVAVGSPHEPPRAHLSGQVGRPSPLDTPPFYAQPSSTVVLATYCGLTVNIRCEVLDVFGDPIGGLLAAGEVMGGFHGGGYMTGTSIGKAAVFGRVAGIAAAARAIEEVAS
ncbi:fumarate reductase flavoprotein subunit [Spinactinospora alkalitolerans]|uniref:Fumarate reductase flavoprotein subunit n=1 Tax=Spinactinospora alkalitolerans TaxID=687207 RepID=A0A852TT26_9ACTN|nr:FAD-dependent oxidoreductase [Spinactinospora alkalitolerans]NYE47169.1 fumarate reductase flavoprotein subunit [Spinactinospora alkalitolerans]